MIPEITYGTKRLRLNYKPKTESSKIAIYTLYTITPKRFGFVGDVQYERENKKVANLSKKNSQKRYFRLQNYFHHISQMIVANCVKHDIGKTIIKEYCDSQRVNFWREHQAAGFALRYVTTNRIDIMQEANMAEAQRKVAPFEGRYELIRKLSTEAANEFPDEYCDFIYIDTNHAYWSVKNDLIAWWPKVKKKDSSGGYRVREYKE